MQEYQTVNSGSELFIVSPKGTGFFGEVHISQYNMGKVKVGQKALIKLKSYPFEQYGMLKGTVTYLSLDKIG
ncbi:HlyD family efflux transporter periplasmic adaptor subunit [Pedobacter sp. GR22-6]|uniref:HlyD family efflux transporter periplasmic adaptor subunit n=1 Tax=Pedobacter sp. GR22-6 TaxID=3127957 RepID=UPI003FCECD5C